MSSEDSGDDRLDPRLLALIGVVLLGGLLGILNSTMAAVATEELAGSLDASLSTVGWASTGFLLAVTATIPFTTWAVDRFGARRLWLVGLAIFLTGSLTAGLAWDVGSLIAFRTLQGFGAGLLDPLVLILLARAAGPHRAGRVMGLMGVVLSLGPVLGPVAGGAVLSGLSWRWMFLLSAPLGLLALVLAVRVLPSDAPASDGTSPGGTSPGGRLDVVGLALLGPGFAAVVLALSQTAERSTVTAWQALLPLALGAALLAGYGVHAARALRAAHDARRTPPLVDPRLFANRGFSASVTIMGLGGVANFAAFFALPFYYQQAHGHGVLAAGLLMSPVGLGGAVAMPLAGRLSDRVGARGLAIGGALLAAACALVFTRFDAGTHELWPVLAALALGLGMGCYSSPTMGSLYRALPAALVAQGSSVLYMLNQLGAALGIACVTLVMQTAPDAITGFHRVFWLVTAVLVLVLCTVPLLPGRPRASAVAAAGAARGAVSSGQSR
ncbi:DHA2 family efflux MFS transporter permease subunit [Streptomyces hainanensis]|uniref:DHA2 family efflux MFS transporter permease subunit n=1 Tax=Streptomyces hainanensis TaxID=402648 RepID=A0A4R4TCD4_9ACTN|nr:DHA2 family efflux MFS transporter permease subunit [Streptomyces hainanensis]TDC73204.1 DHA2 family efflux MFS transporter permease subunit [Streptomyces hainanensis]